MGISRVLVTNIKTTKEDIVSFLLGSQSPAVDVSIAPAQLTGYFNLTTSSLGMASKKKQVLEAIQGNFR